jgi:hypothetical protein
MIYLLEIEMANFSPLWMKVVAKVIRVRVINESKKKMIKQTGRPLSIIIDSKGEGWSAPNSNLTLRTCRSPRHCVAYDFDSRVRRKT